VAKAVFLGRLHTPTGAREIKKNWVCFPLSLDIHANGTWKTFWPSLIINFAMLSAFGHRGAAPAALRRALDSRSGSARLLAVQAHISIKYVGGAGGWSGGPHKKLATRLAGQLESEFQSSQLKVDVMKATTPLSDGLAVVLENTGEVLHTIPQLGASERSYPSETQQLMMISKIGTWLATQPK
jgi:hypothetical protein